MKTSFYLTPELKQRYVYLTLRRKGQLELWDGEALVGQDDPERGLSSLNLSNPKHY